MVSAAFCSLFGAELPWPSTPRLRWGIYSGAGLVAAIEAGARRAIHELANLLECDGAKGVQGTSGP